MIKIGFDIHGVIDNRPEYFSRLSRKFRALGHEIHIITGSFDSPEIRKQLEDWGIEYDHFFGISDWCKENTDTYTINDRGRLYVEDDLWNSVKSRYCEEVGIDIHIDDSEEYYESFIPIATQYVLFKGDEFGAGFGAHSAICDVVKKYDEMQNGKKHCPQFDLYRDKLRNIVKTSTLYHQSRPVTPSIIDGKVVGGFVDVSYLLDELVEDIVLGFR